MEQRDHTMTTLEDLCYINFISYKCWLKSKHETSTMVFGVMEQDTLIMQSVG
jgi:hypothetical protein